MSEQSNPIRFEVTEQQASVLTAGMLLILFFSFVAGYFWAKPAISGHGPAVAVYAQMVPDATHIVVDRATNEELFACEVIRTGSEVAAKAFLERLGHLHIKAFIRKRESVSKAGLVYPWFQLMVGPASKDEASKLTQYAKKIVR